MSTHLAGHGGRGDHPRGHSPGGSPPPCTSSHGRKGGSLPRTELDELTEVPAALPTPPFQGRVTGTLGQSPGKGHMWVVLVAESRKETYSLSHSLCKSPAINKKTGGPEQNNCHPGSPESWAPAESRLFSFCGDPRKLSFWGPHVAPPQPCLHPLRTGRTSNSDSGAPC